MNQAQHEADAAVQAAVELDGVADAAELAAVVLDREELVRRTEARLETLNEQSHDGYSKWYRCVVCSQARRHINEVKNHIISEHWDTLNQVEAVMRREVMARKEANFGVEDPVLWEQYYKTN